MCKSLSLLKKRRVFLQRRRYKRIFSPLFFFIRSFFLGFFYIFWRKYKFLGFFFLLIFKVSYFNLFCFLKRAGIAFMARDKKSDKVIAYKRHMAVKLDFPWSKRKPFIRNPIILIQHFVGTLKSFIIVELNFFGVSFEELNISFFFNPKKSMFRKCIFFYDTMFTWVELDKILYFKRYTSTLSVLRYNEYVMQEAFFNRRFRIALIFRFKHFNPTINYFTEPIRRESIDFNILITANFMLDLYFSRFIVFFSESLPAREGEVILNDYSFFSIIFNPILNRLFAFRKAATLALNGFYGGSLFWKYMLFVYSRVMLSPKRVLYSKIKVYYFWKYVLMAYSFNNVYAEFLEAFFSEMTASFFSHLRNSLVVLHSSMVSSFFFKFQSPKDNVTYSNIFFKDIFSYNFIDYFYGLKNFLFFFNPSKNKEVDSLNKRIEEDKTVNLIITEAEENLDFITKVVGRDITRDDLKGIRFSRFKRPFSNLTDAEIEARQKEEREASVLLFKEKVKTYSEDMLKVREFIFKHLDLMDTLLDENKAREFKEKKLLFRAQIEAKEEAKWLAQLRLDKNLFKDEIAKIQEAVPKIWKIVYSLVRVKGARPHFKNDLMVVKKKVKKFAFNLSKIEDYIAFVDNDELKKNSWYESDKRQERYRADSGIEHAAIALEQIKDRLVSILNNLGVMALRDNVIPWSRRRFLIKVSNLLANNRMCNLIVDIFLSIWKMEKDYKALAYFENKLIKARIAKERGLLNFPLSTVGVVSDILGNLHLKEFKALKANDIVENSYKVKEKLNSREESIKTFKFFFVAREHFLNDLFVLLDFVKSYVIYADNSNIEAVHTDLKVRDFVTKKMNLCFENVYKISSSIALAGDISTHIFQIESYMFWLRKHAFDILDLYFAFLYKLSLYIRQLSTFVNNYYLNGNNMYFLEFFIPYALQIVREMVDESRISVTFLLLNLTIFSKEFLVSTLSVLRNDIFLIFELLEEFRIWVLKEEYFRHLSKFQKRISIVAKNLATIETTVENFFFNANINFLFTKIKHEYSLIERFVVSIFGTLDFYVNIASDDVDEWGRFIATHNFAKHIIALFSLGHFFYSFNLIFNDYKQYFPFNFSFNFHIFWEVISIDFRSNYFPYSTIFPSLFNRIIIDDYLVNRFISSNRFFKCALPFFVVNFIWKLGAWNRKLSTKISKYGLNTFNFYYYFIIRDFYFKTFFASKNYVSNEFDCGLMPYAFAFFFFKLDSKRIKIRRKFLKIFLRIHFFKFRRFFNFMQRSYFKPFNFRYLQALYDAN
jgi:hypothetical protein